MKILLDTNIVLDFLIDREPFSKDVKEIFIMVENGIIDGYLCATTITIIYYLIKKYISKLDCDKIIKDILQLFNIADVNKEVLIKSLHNNGKDFEDSVIYTSAEYFGVDIIITRDESGFKNSNTKVMKLDTFLKYISKKEKL